MPGAAGLVVTNYLYNVAKRDGTVIGMPTSNVPIEPRLKLLSPDGSNVKFDLANFSWIGTPLQEPQVTWVWHTAPAASVDDLKTNTILMGATTASADNAILPMLVDELIGTKMKVLTGYQGQNEINLAAERGEVQGNNTGLSNLTVNKADWLRDGKVRILLQFGNERLPQLPNVPTAIELASSDADKAMLRFYGLKFTMARPLLIPPQVPAERIAALQAAFEATMTGSRTTSRKPGASASTPIGSAPRRLRSASATLPQRRKRWLTTCTSCSPAAASNSWRRHGSHTDRLALPCQNLLYDG